MPPIITLYDLASHHREAWAPNIWRVRFILNYKRLPYRTVWVDIPDVEPTLRAIGAPPTATRSDGRPLFSLPVIVDRVHSSTSPRILSNATLIAEYLESEYPARPVFPDGSRALQTLFAHYIQEVFSRPLLPILIPISHERLPQRSQSHLRATTGHPRAASSSSSSSSSSSAAPPRIRLGGEQAWNAVREQFDILAGILEKNTGSDGDGVVVMGSEVTYADFALCSVLLWIEKMAPHDGWAQVRQWNGGRWDRLLDRCREYTDVY